MAATPAPLTAGDPAAPPAAHPPSDTPLDGFATMAPAELLVRLRQVAVRRTQDLKLIERQKHEISDLENKVAELDGLVGDLTAAKRKDGLAHNVFMKDLQQAKNLQQQAQDG